MIHVTKPFQPPYEKYEALLKEVWQRNWLTNNGPLVVDLESRLRDSLGVQNFSYVANGTLALQLAIRALGLKGQVITTPFTYVATVSSLVWEQCTPVFVDIDPETFNLDPEKVEEKITADTTGIVATHVYGNPCDVENLHAIANRRGLKILYDAAHAFGTLIQGKSVLHWGDASTLSFHATKLFHSVEGGGICMREPLMQEKIDYLRNFGHKGYENFKGLGINAKNSELHAAMGLANLPYVNEILEKRKSDARHYDELLEKLPFQRPKVAPEVDFNHAYYPVVFPSESALLKVKQALEENQIFCRRYFYPDLTRLSYVEEAHTPIARDIASRVLCLPTYYDLTVQELEMVVNIIKKNI